jgi:hypothetical protein
MTVIKPRTRGKHLVAQRIRLDQPNREALYAYAAFIGEDAEYVINQLIETVLAKDRDFVKWRAQRGESFVPRGGRRGRVGRAHAHGSSSTVTAAAASH